MRFNYRILPTDDLSEAEAVDPLPADESGELQLPADLHDLGRQLMADADRLAAAYPSPPSSSDSSAVGEDGSPRRRSRLLAPAISSALVLLIAVGIASSWRGSSWRPVTPSAHGAQSEPSASVARDLAGALPADSNAADSAAADAHADVATHGDSDEPVDSPSLDSVPAIMVLHEATGAELEGLLDILERDSSEQQHENVSI